MTKMKLKKEIDELQDMILSLRAEALSYKEGNMLLEIRERELSKQIEKMRERYENLLEQSKQKYAALLERHIRLLENTECAIGGSNDNT